MTFGFSQQLDRNIQLRYEEELTRTNASLVTTCIAISGINQKVSRGVMLKERLHSWRQ